jgi:putative addiction module component (TIGR02574 family)
MSAEFNVGLQSFLRNSRNTIESTCMEVLTMTNQLELLEAQALQLTSSERAAFAQLLLASLDEDAEIDEAWAAETERRIFDIESGSAHVIPIADALAKVRASLK